MIDLHIHTNKSDGTNTIEEVLVLADKLNLNVISITDHNTCEAYEVMKDIDISKLFKGRIITGCELSTYYNNYIIEILAYGFDISVLNEYLNNYYNKEYWRNRNIQLGENLVSILVNNYFFINLDKCVITKEEYSYYGIKKVYDEIIKYKDNIVKLKSYNINSFNDFLRKGIYNKESIFYLNYEKFLPALKDVINTIHDAGGLAFLAHPLQYEFNNITKTLKEILKIYNLDGLECFYTTFSEEETNYLIDFAKENGLLISGGSDYHGTNKKNHDLGTGNNNLNIDEKLIETWNIKYFK